MINQTKKHHKVVGQIEYLGRWVDKEHFRAFVYNGKEQKLAKNYHEFAELISSGVWFATQKDAEEYLKEYLPTKKTKPNSKSKTAGAE